MARRWQSFSTDTSPALVVIDTMTSLTDGPEDDNDTIRDFYRHTGRIVEERGIALLRLDHRGKDRTAGQRGASHKAGDVDVVFELTVKGSMVTLARTHSRPKWVPAEVRLGATRGAGPASRPRRPALDDTEGPSFSPADVAVAKVLDDLGVPRDASKRVALDALRSNDHRGREAVVLRALKLRRQRA